MIFDALSLAFPREIVSKIIMFSHETMPSHLQKEIRTFKFSRNKRRKKKNHCPFCEKDHEFPRHFKCFF